jgi:hypothetical protein
VIVHCKRCRYELSLEPPKVHGVCGPHIDGTWFTGEDGIERRRRRRRLVDGKTREPLPRVRHFNDNIPTYRAVTFPLRWACPACHGVNTVLSELT